MVRSLTMMHSQVDDVTHNIQTGRFRTNGSSDVTSYTGENLGHYLYEIYRARLGLKPNSNSA